MYATAAQSEGIQLYHSQSLKHGLGFCLRLSYEHSSLGPSAMHTDPEQRTCDRVVIDCTRLVRYLSSTTAPLVHDCLLLVWVIVATVAFCKLGALVWVACDYFLLLCFVRNRSHHLQPVLLIPSGT